MSTFTYPVRVANPQGDGDPLELKLLVDTGAMFTCLPRAQLGALGLTSPWIAFPSSAPCRWGSSRSPSTR